MELPEFPEVFGNYTLQGFQEILAPGPINWWPQTIGWQIVGVLLLLLTLRWCWRGARAWWRDRYRREAARTLSRILETPAQPQNQLAAIAELLKATALFGRSRDTVAGLSGQQWLDWLDRQTEAHLFQGRSRELLTVQLYQANPAVSAEDVRALAQASAAWIHQHRSPHD